MIESLVLLSRTVSGVLSTRRKGDMDTSLVFKLILGFVIILLVVLFVMFVTQRGKEKLAGLFGVVE